MSDLPGTMSMIEAVIGVVLRLVGSGFKILCVLVILGGVALTLQPVSRGWWCRIPDDAHDKSAKIGLGRSLWLGL
jgi:hypothetical protein